MSDPSHTAPVIELAHRDIDAWRAGNTGVDYVTTLDSGRSGPHVMINALTHGNEVCGAHALCALLAAGMGPTQGRLTLSFANVAAYRRFDPHTPFESRFVDEDFNRVWDAQTLDGPRRSAELERARALRPVVDTVDLLLDLHSTSLANPPMLMCGMQDKGLALARAIGYPEFVVIDAGHAAGRRLRDYGPFADPASHKVAMLVECGQHFEAAAADVALETAVRFLRHCKVVDADFGSQYLRSEPAAQTTIRVTEALTITTPRFAFARDYAGFEVIPEAGTVIARDGGTEVRTPYDDCVMVMPARDTRRGLTAVRLGQIVE